MKIDKGRRFGLKQRLIWWRQRTDPVRILMAPYCILVLVLRLKLGSIACGDAKAEAKILNQRQTCSYSLFLE